MDIKSKKWKSAVSFGAFALGVSLVLASGIWLSGTAERMSAAGENPIETDYQNTEEFRSFIEGRLFHFIEMACGSRIGYGYSSYYYDYYGDDYYDYYGAEFWESEENTAVAGTFSEEDGSSSEEWKERYRQEAEDYHNSIKNDRNLLYRVVNGKEELYSNMEDVAWENWDAPLPEGYNFALYFDGEKVHIKKDGAELDVYGDDYYDGDAPGSWRVPGYQNFVMEGTGQVRIYLLAVETPFRYVYMNYRDDGYMQTSSTLYDIAQRVTTAAARFRKNIAEFLAGIVLLMVSFLWRKEKRQADAAVARVTGRIWFEWKLLIFAVALAVSIGVLLGALGTDFGYGMAYDTVVATDGGATDAAESVVQEAAFAGEMELLSMMSWEIRYILRERVYLFLPLFWICYLGANDIRRNRKTFWQGGISRLVGIFRERNYKSAFSEELMKKTKLLGIADGFVLLVSILLCGSLAGSLRKESAAILVPVFAAVSILLIVLIHSRYLKELKGLAEDMDVLTERMKVIRDGDYERKEYKITETSKLYEAARNLEEIRDGMEQAVCERVKSEQMKVELVTNVSHDIKTPLTSIISYVQFLKQEEDLPEHVKDYIRVLDEKADRLNHMVQDVFAVSKAAAGQLPVEIEVLDFARMLRQTLADMDEKINQSAVRLVAEFPEEPVFIEADGKRMYRVFQNLIDNALKYSLEGSRVFVTLKAEAGTAVSTVKNISKEEILAAQQLTERFVRGDESRTDGGSGLGLSIAKSFTEACGGSFGLSADADLFVVTVTFPEVSADMPGSARAENP